MKDRNQEIHVLLTPEEMDQLQRKMKEAGIRNRSAYVRKMALDGYVVNLDMSDIREVISLLRRNSDVFSAIFHCLIDEKPMAFRRHYTLSSAIYRKEIKRIVGSKTYNRLIPSILSNSSKSAYFKPTTDLLTNSPFSEAI